MNNNRIIVMIIFGFVFATKFSFAQSLQGQWPPRYDTYRSGWQNNYVSRNYDPYVNQTQFRNQPIPQPGYRAVATPLLPVYGNSMPMMPYNPWQQTYGVMPSLYFPMMNFPILNYPGWAY
ncbi:MAG: hypothetical protein ACC653_10980 [Gammaproteobacteria bacterium]